VDGVDHSNGNRIGSTNSGYHHVRPGPNGEVGSAAGYAGILPNSKWVYNIQGSTTMEWARTAHHQAVDPKKLGKGITIVAYTSDGVVEAIEHQDSLFAVGTQWHPEYNVLGINGQSELVGLDYDQSVAYLWEHVKYAGVHMDRSALFAMFKNGELPDTLNYVKFDFNNSNFLEYTGVITDQGTLLSNSMLDGWNITGVTLQDTTGCTVEVNGGSVVVTLKEDVDDGTVLVKLTKGGVTKEARITFSGTKTADDDDDDDSKGCNVAHGLLVLAFSMGAVPFIFSRRK